MKTECAAPAPATQRVNKEAVRLLVIQEGTREAARIAGLNENTVLSWAHRYGWKTAIKTQSNGHSALVERVSDELQTHERETRLSLARSARKLASEAEGAKLNESSHILNVAKTAAVVHKWGDEKQNVLFSLNVLNLNMLSDSESDSPRA